LVRERGRDRERNIYIEREKERERDIEKVSESASLRFSVVTTETLMCWQTNGTRFHKQSRIRLLCFHKS